ncbi:MAG: hypothetical protein M1609_11665 [Firmicutes bacterium]|nr:hypothetical protein [Bacillota bacterium]
MTVLEKQFNSAMKKIYNRAKAECGYNAGYFLKLLSERGGLGAAKYLLQTRDISSGFTELCLCGRLDLTVEAYVLKPEFKELFTEEELRGAELRLREHGYFR